MSTDNIKSRGSNGVLGEATNALKMKQLWWKEGKGFSLKQFARRLLKDKDQVAIDWFAAKKGSNNKGRSDENIKLATLCSTATRNGRGRSKSTNTKTKSA